MSRFPDSGDTPDHLPVATLSQRQWLRISAIDYPTPLHWAINQPGRFTPTSGHAGTLYLADTLICALAESICRDAVWLPASRKFTSIARLQAQNLYDITVPCGLRVIDFTVPHLAKYRLDAQIWSQRDPANGYLWGPTWAAKAIALGLDGIQYFSRSHTQSKCLALFGNANTPITWQLRHSLMEDSVLEILEREFDWGII